MNGSRERRQLEIDFVANQGNKRYYIKSAYDIIDEEKMKQESKSFYQTYAFNIFDNQIIVSNRQKLH